jgi:hypothetical protein
MTPKEKARELWQKYYDALTESFAHNDMSKEVAKALYHGDAIRYALIAVDETIRTLHDYAERGMLSQWGNAVGYWVEVKQEIEKQ